MLTDRALLQKITTEADLKAAQKAGPVYVYRFDWPSAALNGRFGAVHAMDSALVFRNNHQALVGGDTLESRAVADKMASAWVAFARTGHPASELLPDWPAYTAEKRTVMVINHPHSRAVDDPNHSFRVLWSELARRS
jgi:para-nitrobenzyl esterase